MHRLACQSAVTIETGKAKLHAVKLSGFTSACSKGFRQVDQHILISNSLQPQ